MTRQDVLEQVLFHAKLRGLSKNTQDEYYTKTKQFQDFFDKPATELSVDHVQLYLYHLYVEKKLSSGTVNTYNSGLRFLYNIVLEKPISGFKIPRHKRNRKIPVILTREEVIAIIDACHNLRDKCMIMLMYSAGLRISEVSSLRVSDIDSKKMQIFIDQGKGNKDGFAILSETALSVLREYWLKYKPKGWLFYSRNATGTHITSKATQNLFKKAVQSADITKDITCHSMRHAFATHLLEDGVSIFHIKQLLRHSDISTTCFYLQVVKINELNVISPLDKFLNQRNSNA